MPADIARLLERILAETRALREINRPRLSLPIVVSNASIIGSGTLQPTLTATYQTVREWVPKKPGGILKQIFLSGGLLVAYKIVLDGREVANDLIFAQPTNAEPLPLDFKRQPVGVDGEGGVVVQAKITSASGGQTTEVIIHGEQVIVW